MLVRFSFLFVFCDLRTEETVETSTQKSQCSNHKIIPIIERNKKERPRDRERDEKRRTQIN